jgi:adenylosuccinate lyase
MTVPLHLLSPLDGRYADATAPLRDYFSEFAFLRDRARLELDFLCALSKAGLIRPLTESELCLIEAMIQNFNLADAEAIRAFERETRHDVKAIVILRSEATKNLRYWKATCFPGCILDLRPKM